MKCKYFVITLFIFIKTAKERETDITSNSLNVSDDEYIDIGGYDALDDEIIFYNEKLAKLKTRFMKLQADEKIKGVLHDQNELTMTYNNNFITNKEKYIDTNNSQCLVINQNETNVAKSPDNTPGIKVLTKSKSFKRLKSKEPSKGFCIQNIISGAKYNTNVQYSGKPHKEQKIGNLISIHSQGCASVQSSGFDSDVLAEYGGNLFSTRFISDSNHLLVTQTKDLTTNSSLSTKNCTAFSIHDLLNKNSNTISNIKDKTCSESCKFENNSYSSKTNEENKKKGKPDTNFYILDILGSKERLGDGNLQNSHLNALNKKTNHSISIEKVNDHCNNIALELETQNNVENTCISTRLGISGTEDSNTVIKNSNTRNEVNNVYDITHDNHRLIYRKMDTSAKVYEHHGRMVKKRSIEHTQAAENLVSKNYTNKGDENIRNFTSKSNASCIPQNTIPHSANIRSNNGKHTNFSISEIICNKTEYLLHNTSDCSQEIANSEQIKSNLFILKSTSNDEASVESVNTSGMPLDKVYLEPEEKKYKYSDIFDDDFKRSSRKLVKQNKNSFENNKKVQNFDETHHDLSIPLTPSLTHELETIHSAIDSTYVQELKTFPDSLLLSINSDEVKKRKKERKLKKNELVCVNKKHKTQSKNKIQNSLDEILLLENASTILQVNSDIVGSIYNKKEEENKKLVIRKFKLKRKRTEISKATKNRSTKLDDIEICTNINNITEKMSNLYLQEQFRETKYSRPNVNSSNNFFKYEKCLQENQIENARLFEKSDSYKNIESANIEDRNKQKICKNKKLLTKIDKKTKSFTQVTEKNAETHKKRLNSNQYDITKFDASIHCGKNKIKQQSKQCKSFIVDDQNPVKKFRLPNFSSNNMKKTRDKFNFLFCQPIIVAQNNLNKYLLNSKISDRLEKYPEKIAVDTNNSNALNEAVSCNSNENVITTCESLIQDKIRIKNQFRSYIENDNFLPEELKSKIMQNSNNINSEGEVSKKSTESRTNKLLLDLERATKNCEFEARESTRSEKVITTENLQKLKSYSPANSSKYDKDTAKDSESIFISTDSNSGVKLFFNQGMQTCENGIYKNQKCRNKKLTTNKIVKSTAQNKKTIKFRNEENIKIQKVRKSAVGTKKIKSKKMESANFCKVVSKTFPKNLKPTENKNLDRINRNMTINKIKNLKDILHNTTADLSGTKGILNKKCKLNRDTKNNPADKTSNEETINQHKFKTTNDNMLEIYPTSLNYREINVIQETKLCNASYKDTRLFEIISKTSPTVSTKLDLLARNAPYKVYEQYVKSLDNINTETVIECYFFDNQETNINLAEFYTSHSPANLDMNKQNKLEVQNVNARKGKAKHTKPIKMHNLKGVFDREMDANINKNVQYYNHIIPDSHKTPNTVPEAGFIVPEYSKLYKDGFKQREHVLSYSKKQTNLQIFQGKDHYNQIINAPTDYNNTSKVSRSNVFSFNESGNIDLRNESSGNHIPNYHIVTPDAILYDKKEVFSETDAIYKKSGSAGLTLIANTKIKAISKASVLNINHTYPMPNSDRIVNNADFHLPMNAYEKIGGLEPGNDSFEVKEKLTNFNKVDPGLTHKKDNIVLKIPRETLQINIPTAYDLNEKSLLPKINKYNIAQISHKPITSFYRQNRIITPFSGKIHSNTTLKPNQGTKISFKCFKNRFEGLWKLKFPDIVRLRDFKNDLKKFCWKGDDLISFTNFDLNPPICEEIIKKYEKYLLFVRQKFCSEEIVFANKISLLLKIQACTDMMMDGDFSVLKNAAIKDLINFIWVCFDIKIIGKVYDSNTVILLSNTFFYNREEFKKIEDHKNLCTENLAAQLRQILHKSSEGNRKNKSQTIHFEIKKNYNEMIKMLDLHIKYNSVNLKLVSSAVYNYLSIIEQYFDVQAPIFIENMVNCLLRRLKDINTSTCYSKIQRIGKQLRLESKNIIWDGNYSNNIKNMVDHKSIRIKYIALVIEIIQKIYQ